MFLNISHHTLRILTVGDPANPPLVRLHSLGSVVAQIVAAKAGPDSTGLAVFDSYIVSLNPQMWRDRAAAAAGAGLQRMFEMGSAKGYAAACDALAIMDSRDVIPRITCQRLWPLNPRTMPHL